MQATTLCIRTHGRLTVTYHLTTERCRRMFTSHWELIFFMPATEHLRMMQRTLDFWLGH